MKRVPIVLTTICLLLTACAGASSPPPIATPRPRPTPRIRNTTYYTKRCWPACHYDTTVVKPAPQPSIHDFDEELASGWTWINEDATHWTLTEVPGALRIVSQGGSISEGLQNAQNILVRDAPGGHFDIITKVTFNPTSTFQNASLFIQLNDNHLISLSRGYCREGDGPSCVGSGLYFDGPEPGCITAGVPTSAGTVFLMLRKAGTSYVGYYRLDEGDWVEVSRCINLMMAPTKVGLAVTNGNRDPDIPEIPADFDFFTLVERY